MGLRSGLGTECLQAGGAGIEPRRHGPTSPHVTTSGERSADAVGAAMTNPRRIHRGMALVLVAAIALAACGDDDDSTDTTIGTTTTEASVTTTEATTTSVAETTTTTAPTTTTTATTTTLPPLTAPPTAEQTDWIPIVEELYARKIALAAVPDRTAEVAVEGQPSFDAIFTSASDLAAQGLHLELDPLGVARADLVRVTNVLPDGSPGAVTLIVWYHLQGGRGAVDANGNVVIPLGDSPFPIPEGSLPRSNISIRRFAPAEPWRFEVETQIPPAAP